MRGEAQTLQGKPPKLSRISHTISGKRHELPTDLDTKLIGSIRINKRLMRSHYQPDKFKSLRLRQTSDGANAPHVLLLASQSPKHPDPV